MTGTIATPKSNQSQFFFPDVNWRALCHPPAQKRADGAADAQSLGTAFSPPGKCEYLFGDTPYFCRKLRAKCDDET